ncbi:MAG: ATP-binding protein [Myxococcota bacterium]
MVRWIDREISDALLQAARTRPALVVSGARQTGKTSLVRRLFPTHSYVSLDLPAKAEQAERDPDAFFAAHPPPVVIDEVQYAPSVFRSIKRDIDAHRQHYGRFVLTGSQRYVLMKEVGDSLAGRASLFDLPPLSYREIKRSTGAVSISDVIVRGGYPELWENPELDATEFYAAYVATYLERDVRNLLQVGNLRDFDRFIRASALRSANVTNKSELARDVGIAASTANQWLSVLEAADQVLMLEPWFNNRTRSMTKSPKLYLGDTGLLCALLGVRDEDDLLRTPSIGAIWESFVFNELRKRHRLARPGQQVFYWRDRNAEVDFILHRAGRFESLEAKWSDTSAQLTRGMHAFESHVKAEVQHRIVTRTQTSRKVDGVAVVGPDDAWFDGDQPSSAETP